MKRDEFNPLTSLRQSLAKAKSCESHPELRKPETIEECELWRKSVENCSDNMKRQHLRWLCRNDLFFFAVYGLHMGFVIGDDYDQFPYDPRDSDEAVKARHKDRNWRQAQWCFERCKEYELDPYNHLDLWSRESFKSELITFTSNIQAIIRNPNETIGMFSHTRPIAKTFLMKIKRELEANQELKELFSDILYRDPEHEAQPWGLDVGLLVKRTSNRKEASFEAWGLVDGQPTGRRFTILSYDDVIARKETTEYMIPKVTEEFRNSLFLSAGTLRFRYVATFQEIGDTTQQLMDSGFKARIRPSVTAEGKSLCLSDEKLAAFNQAMTPKEMALQIYLDPAKAKGNAQLGFRTEWLQYYDRESISVLSLNKYILVDPSGVTKTNAHSYYALLVVGLAPDGRYKLLDACYDKVNLDQRTELLKEKVLLWKPLRIFYEKQAMQSDIEHIRAQMRRELWECEIVEVGTNQLRKDERIEALIPLFSNHLFQLPKEGIAYRLRSADVAAELKLPAGSTVDLMKLFVDRELLRWPFSHYKDMLDALSWLKWQPIASYISWPRRYGDQGAVAGPWGVTDPFTSGGWMAE